MGLSFNDESQESTELFNHYNKCQQHKLKPPQNERTVEDKEQHE
jgi:hypothetical protein